MGVKLNRKDHGCLTDCVAKYLGLPSSEVPFFISRKRYRRSLERFFHKHGLHIHPVKYKKELLKNSRKKYFVQGISPRMKKQRKEHMVLYRGTKKYFDPHPSQSFLKGCPLWIWIVTKL